MFKRSFDFILEAINWIIILRTDMCITIEIIVILNFISKSVSYESIDIIRKLSWKYDIKWKGNIYTYIWCSFTKILLSNLFSLGWLWRHAFVLINCSTLIRELYRTLVKYQCILFKALHAFCWIRNKFCYSDILML